MTTVIASELQTQQEFLSQLIGCKHLIPSAEHGVYGRGMEFERLRTAVDFLITSISAPDCPETPHFPPIIPKRTLERAGYLKSVANTACLGFGLERITLALFRKHGMDTNTWSSEVRDQLGNWL